MKLSRVAACLLVMPTLVACGATVPVARTREVYVDFQTKDPNATLERREDGSDSWDVVCNGACRRTMHPAEYRVAGEAITPSPPFVIDRAATVNVEKTGSDATHTLGTVGVAIGVPLMILGGLLSLASLVPTGGHGGSESPVLVVGGLMFVGGGLLFTSGLIAQGNASTNVDVRERGPTVKLAFLF